MGQLANDLRFSLRSVRKAPLVVVLPLAYLMRSQLFGMSPADPLAIGGVACFILAAALAASIVPALRASRIAPVEVLRDE